MNKKIKGLLVFFTIYFFTADFYLYISKGIPVTDRYADLIMLMIAVFVASFPYGLFENIKTTAFFPEMVIVFLWSFSIPFLTYIAYTNIKPVISPESSIATGFLLFAILTLIRIFYNRLLSLKQCRFLNYIYAIVLFILILIPIVNITYFCLFKQPITQKAMLAIFQTNVVEAYEYILSASPLITIISATFLFLIVSFSIKIIFSKQDKLTPIFTNKFKLLIYPILMFFSAFILSINIIPQSSLGGLIIHTHKYFAAIHNYKNGRDNILQTLQVQQHNKINTPHTIILVIGESATKNYMHAFGYNDDNTTPWLSRNKHNFLIFNNAYSGAWATVPALEHALTEANYYNNKEFNASISIIDIAKKLGYKTYWFSNQGKIGPYDTPITMVAETAHIKHWSSGSNYDDCLLMHLKKINKKENNFVVFHIYGSHTFYNHRYPKEYQKWTDPGGVGKVADYKNSILFTDHILEEIYNYGHNNLNMDAMIYFSDHGSDPLKLRDPDNPDFIGLRIPLFVYLSPSYKDAHPKISQTLNQNSEQFFSNDLIYNLICGILDIRSNHYNESESIASPFYKFNKNDIKTDEGKQLVKNDPYL